MNETNVNGTKGLFESFVRRDLHIMACDNVKAYSRYDGENGKNSNATQGEFIH